MPSQGADPEIVVGPIHAKVLAPVRREAMCDDLFGSHRVVGDGHLMGDIANVSPEVTCSASAHHVGPMAENLAEAAPQESRAFLDTVPLPARGVAAAPEPTLGTPDGFAHRRRVPRRVLGDAKELQVAGHPDAS